MGESFRGWRRKAGCVTLVMALACTGGWARSLNIEDVLEVKTAPSSVTSLSSKSGIIEWYQLYDPEPDSLLLRGYDTPIRYLSRTPAGRPWSESSEFEYYVTKYGFTFGRRHYRDRWSDDLTKIAVPYFAVVMLLAVLSGCLLFSKPRNSPETKPS